MLIHKEKLTLTPSSGSVSGKTTRFTGLLAHAITVSPATSSTTWKISIADQDGDVIFDLSNTQTGTVAKQCNLPFRGTYTVSITSASADEAFKVIIWSEDRLT